MVSWALTAPLVGFFYYSACVKRLVRLVPEFDQFPNCRFSTFICLVALNLDHTRPTPFLNVIIIIFVNVINMIIYVVSFFIRHGRRCALAMIIFMMYTVTLIHIH